MIKFISNWSGECAIPKPFILDSASLCILKPNCFLLKDCSCGEKVYFFSYLGSIQPMKYIYIYNNKKERKRKQERIRKNPYKL